MHSTLGETPVTDPSQRFLQQLLGWTLQRDRRRTRGQDCRRAPARSISSFASLAKQTTERESERAGSEKVYTYQDQRERANFILPGGDQPSVHTIFTCSPHS